MKVVIQRVKKAEVEVDNKVVGKIEKGMLIFFATTHDDEEKQIPWLVNKIVNLRIFSDENGKLNLSLKDISGGILAVSQFTLYGDCSAGRRPSFIKAQEPQKAEPLYKSFVDMLKKEVKNVQTGIFGADMQVSLTNDGPVTFIVEGKK